MLWVAIGLFAAGVWTNMVGYSINLLPTDTSVAAGVYNRDAFLWGRLAVAVAFIAFAGLIPRVHATLVSVTAVVMSAATFVIVVSYHQSLFDPWMFASTGVFVSSCCYAVMVWGFYVFLARSVQTEQSVVVITLSIILETVFSILFSLYLPAMTQMLVVICAPLVVAACYYCALRFFRGCPTEAGGTRTGTAAGAFGTCSLLAVLVMLTSALVFIRALSNVGIWGIERSNFTGMAELSVSELVLICALVAAMAYLVFILPRRRLTLMFRCIVGFAVMLAGLQLLAITSDTGFGYSFDAVTTATELFSHLVRWMAVIVCIRSLAMPDFRISGISNIAYAALSLLWAHGISQLAFATSTFVMVVVYLFLFIVIVIFAVSLTRHEAPFASRAQEDEEESRHVAFALRHRLSPRETQVLRLLLSGNKRIEIEREYALSEGTVKTHISNIYKKLDVHSKRDLLARYSQFNEGEGSRKADGGKGDTRSDGDAGRSARDAGRSASEEE
jgi:DNA-binding CsgD family transcriptional regulator